MKFATCLYWALNQLISIGIYMYLNLLNCWKPQLLIRQKVQVQSTIKYIQHFGFFWNLYRTFSKIFLSNFTFFFSGMAQIPEGLRFFPAMWFRSEVELPEENARRFQGVNQVMVKTTWTSKNEVSLQILWKFFSEWVIERN